MSTAPSPQKNRCAYNSGYFEVSPRGVYFHGKVKDGNDLMPQWLCSELRVSAQTRDARNGDWGRFLEWQDNDGNPHHWAMPLELLEGDGSDVRRELASKGLSIAPSTNARNLLAAYIKVWPVDARARCVERLGWHDDVFVTPTAAIGASNERIVFQNNHAIELATTLAGTAAQWRDFVAALARGNSRLMFALSCAFAGPLLKLVGEDSGGFHLRGGSSTGKSTALKVASSVWGHPLRFVRTWRLTTNGLEGLAVLHNDSILILDELSQVDPGAAGDAAYMLANGQGKARANRNGQAKATQHWRELFLSAGEESLSAIMERAGKKANAGQDIRLAEIEADAGAGLGLFEELHGYASPATLALALKDSAETYHGCVGEEWLGFLVRDRQTLVDLLPQQIKRFLDAVVPEGAEGQVSRVARRFAVVAIAGETATRYGLTGWDDGDATCAASKCFASWLAGFGGAHNREQRAILDQVLGFIEAHGTSRFEGMKSGHDVRIPNRVGFFRTNGQGERELLVLVQSFRQEVCRGIDYKSAIRVLKKAGVLVPDKDGKPTQSIRLPGMGPTRVYVIRYRREAE